VLPFDRHHQELGLEGGGVGGDGDGAGAVRHGSSGGLVSTVVAAP
jgi:hypothetical protein